MKLHCHGCASLRNWNFATRWRGRGGRGCQERFMHLVWRGQEKGELMHLGWEAVGGRSEHLGGEQGLCEFLVSRFLVLLSQLGDC